jgi:dihydropteroate synthase
MFTLQSKGKILSLNTPVVMGIVNLTSDSFYAQSRSQSVSEALTNIESMIQDGASIIDLGAQSTRPGATLLSDSHELKQLIPVIEAVREKFPTIWMSIDTFYAKVADECIDAGAHIINDISAGEFEPQMLEVVAKHKVPYIAMHKKGNPQTMQLNPEYINVTQEVLNYFVSKKNQFEKMGIYDWILDLGYGFGKTVSHNYQLLNESEIFSVIGRPILTGISRKSMIYKPLNISQNEALNGTTALNMIALERGSNILRVHDVKEAVECIEIHSLLKNKSR